MNTLKIFILIVILITIGVVVFIINYTKQPLPEIQPIKLPVEEKISAPEEGKEPEAIKVGVTLISVYDNYQVNPELKTAWGFGSIVKTEKENILFDTGGNSEILLFNMGKLDISPKSIDKVVISHIHGDHLGGLEGFLKENNEVLVFIPISFPDSIRNMIKNYGADFIDVSEPIKISESVWSTGELYGPPEEQSLVIVSINGLIVITGCGHPGVVKITKFAKKMFPEEEVYLVMGGFHHPPLSVVKELRELGVIKVAPSHCTGEPAREKFRKEYKEDFIEYGVGKIIKIKEK